MAAEERQRAEEGTAPNPEPTAMTVGASIDDWLKSVDVRPSTRAEYRASADVYKEILGKDDAGRDRLVAELTLADLRRPFEEVWRDASGRKRGWRDRSGRTKLKHSAMLVRWLDHAVDNNAARENVARKIKPQKTWTREARKNAATTGQALTVEEARKLLAACRDGFKVDTTPRKLRAGPGRAGRRAEAGRPLAPAPERSTR